MFVYIGRENADTRYTIRFALLVARAPNSVTTTNVALPSTSTSIHQSQHHHHLLSYSQNVHVLPIPNHSINPHTLPPFIVHRKGSFFANGGKESPMPVSDWEQTGKDSTGARHPRCANHDAGRFAGEGGKKPTNSSSISSRSDREKGQGTPSVAMPPAPTPAWRRERKNKQKQKRRR